jgi:predicted nucleic acid-binding protein
MQEFLLNMSASQEQSISAAAITYAEMSATFRRALRGGRITEAQYNQAITGFQEQWENVDVPQVNDQLILRSGRIAQEHALRGCDAFQLASALEIEADMFVGCDDELQEAAQENGLVVWNPVNGSYFERSATGQDSGEGQIQE